ncbi:MAG: hypothetical protein AB7P37_21170 [Ramlibacter sp.]
MSAPNYARPTLGWIKRRARRLQRFYGVTRRLAIFDAWRDYMDFTAGRTTRLVVLTGGKK